MDNNLIFEKIWKDGDLIELKITAISEYVNAFQNCYVENSFLEEASVIISEYIKNYNKECYIEFGKKEGNFTPAFSMKFLSADIRGHVKIEVDLEISDSDERVHRCCFYVNSELGLIEKWGKDLSVLGDKEIGDISNLNNVD